MSKNPYLLHGNELDRTEAARRAGQSQPAPRVDSALNPKAAWPFPKTKAEIEAEANAKPRAGEHPLRVAGEVQMKALSHDMGLIRRENERLKAERNTLAAQNWELVEAAELLMRQYDAEPDFRMGGQLTNEPFLMFRSILAKHGR